MVLCTHLVVALQLGLSLEGLSLVERMGHPSTLLFTDFTKGRITEEFDEDVRNKTIEMDDSKEALLAAKRLKEEGNQ